MNIFRQVMNYLEILKKRVNILLIRDEHIFKMSSYIYSSIKYRCWYNNLGSNKNFKYFRIKKYGKKFSSYSWVFVCSFSFFV